MTYRDVKASLGISSTSIYSILHEHLAVKKICSRWIPHKLTIAQYKDCVVWCKEMLENTVTVLQKTFIRSSQVIYVSWIYAYDAETKQQSTVWVFEDESCSWKNHFEPQFVCLKLTEKFEKRTREDESLFTMTMRALTHRLKPAPL